MSSASNSHRSLGERGVTSLEIALSFVVFILLSFGVIDLSRYLYSQQALQTLVTAAARSGYAGSVHRVQTGDATSRTMLANYAPLLDPTQVTSFTMDQAQQDQGVPNGQAPATGIYILSVTATYQFVPLTPMLSNLLGPISATATLQY